MTSKDPDLIAVLLLYAITMFTGATLLFVVQPMVGKMILPLLGGTPAVWSTCMAQSTDFAPNQWISIDRDGRVTIINSVVEMGQGSLSTMPAHPSVGGPKPGEAAIARRGKNRAPGLRSNREGYQSTCDRRS